MPDMYPVTIIRSSRRTLALSVRPDGSVEVKAPLRIPMRLIDEFIENNEDWIEKRRVHVQKAQSFQKTYTQGEKFLYLGKEYSLDVGNYPSIKIEGEKLLFPQGLLFRVKKEIENWYIKQAKEVISRTADDYAKQMKTSYVSIKLSDTSSQWGSCTYDNRLQFSWRLIMTPLLVLTYVVAHELAHTIEKNHSFLFWAKVRSVNPSYKQQIKWLKLHGNTLVS